MIKTAIEWADDTLNFWEGCEKVSAACKNCYAERRDQRFSEGRHWGPGSSRRLRLEKAIKDLASIARLSVAEGRKRRVFMQSLSDTFEDRPDLEEPRKRMWEALHNHADRVVPMLLTKRPAQMAAWAKRYGWPAGAWAGASVEDQANAVARIPYLLHVPAQVRFLSCEPLLGPVDLSAIPWEGRRLNALSGICTPVSGSGYWTDCPTIHWVIAGGESQTGARPTHPDWVRGLRDQCAASGVPFFFKQWGEWIEAGHAHVLDNDQQAKILTDLMPWKWEAGGTFYRAGKKLTGRLLDNVEHSEVPAVRAVRP